MFSMARLQGYTYTLWGYLWAYPIMIKTTRFGTRIPTPYMLNTQPHHFILQTEIELTNPMTRQT